MWHTTSVTLPKDIMRHPASRFLVLLFMALFIGVTAPAAFADARSDAKVHYQAGMKAYSAADYRTAIKEFSSALQLAPADLMNYNLALCYDKLGEAEPAIQYYKEYLAKVPNAGNRTEIEASVSRLEGALKSAAQKRADEQRAADDARKAEEARKAEDARKAAEAAAAANKPVEPATTGTGTGTGATVAPDVGPTQPTGVGSTGTPGTGEAVSTGDAQLDRASAINIDEIRAQRMGMGTPGVGGAAMGTQGGQGGQGAMGAQANAGPTGAQGTTPGMPPEAAQPDQPKKPTPVYKKWWFWVVVAISAVVVYQIATEGSNSETNARGRELPPGPPRAATDGGFTLLHF
jgi:hypothetical protein